MEELAPLLSICQSPNSITSEKCRVIILIHDWLFSIHGYLAYYTPSNVTEEIMNYHVLYIAILNRKGDRISVHTQLRTCRPEHDPSSLQHIRLYVLNENCRYDWNKPIKELTNEHWKFPTLEIFDTTDIKTILRHATLFSPSFLRCYSERLTNDDMLVGFWVWQWCQSAADQ